MSALNFLAAPKNSLIYGVCDAFCLMPVGNGTPRDETNVCLDAVLITSLSGDSGRRQPVEPDASSGENRSG